MSNQEMVHQVVTVTTVEQTLACAKALAEELSQGDVVVLEGGLGAGKTHFVKGMASYFGLKESDVQSPTYALVHEYEGRHPVHSTDVTIYHFDLYRLESDRELMEIGFEEYIYGDGICVIEWPQLAQNHLPLTITKVSIQQNGESRVIEIARGVRYVAEL